MSSACVYLAGPIRDHTYDSANSWRRHAESLLRPGIRPINPLRAKAALRTVGTLGKHEDYEDLLHCRPSEVLARDRFDLSRSDLVLMHFPDPRPSVPHIGSLIEVGWADAYRIPLVVSGFEAFRHHPMMEAIVAWKCKDLDEAIKVCNDVLAPFVKED